MADQVAEVELRAKSTGLRAQLREARHMFGQWADGITSKLAGGMGRLFASKKGFLGKGSFFGDASRGAAGHIAAGATGRSVDFLTNLGKGVFDFEQKLTRLKIQAGETPEEMAKFKRSLVDASNATGISKGEILDGANAFVTLTGRMDIAKASAATFAKVATATGSKTEDIATAADALFQQFGIGATDFETAFSGMTAQGKAGAIELKDMAAELSTIAPQWAQFAGGKGLRGARELGAAMQIVKKGFGGDAGETTVGLSNFLTAVAKKADRFGVKKIFDVKDGKKQLKDVFTIIDNISKSKLARDDTALRKAFGSIEAYRAYIQLRDNRAELQRLTKVAEDGGVIQRDFHEFMSSSSGKIAQSWEQVKNTIAEALTPERIQAAVEGFGQLAQHAGFIAGALGKVGDFFGGVKKFGAGVRGFITQENRITLTDRALAKAGDEKAQLKIANLTAGADYAKIRAADSPEARRMLGLKAQSSADLAYMFSEAQGPGAAAKRRAAEKYYQEMGITKDPTKLFEQMAASLDAIKQLAAQGAEIKIGADPVAKAAKNAPSNRGKVKP